MVSDTLLRFALCVAQGSLDFDTPLRFVTLGDSESPVKRYTSVLRPFGLLNAPVMRYTLVFRAPLSSIIPPNRAQGTRVRMIEDRGARNTRVYRITRH